MTRLAPAALFILTASALSAEESRQLDAHEHGVGQMNIAFDGQQVAIELQAPGADIVGFEFAAESAEDRAKVDNAVATLAKPLDLFVLPEAAGCSVVEARASLESEDDHDEHDHDDHAKHEEEGHNHEEHAEKEHDHEDHAAHKEEDHDHDDHVAEASHTEFHAEYLLNCADPAEVTQINFAYFETFPNALELEVQLISDRGATAFEVERDAPTLDLRDMF